jgi:hypothetical protein
MAQPLVLISPRVSISRAPRSREAKRKNRKAKRAGNLSHKVVGSGQEEYEESRNASKSGRGFLCESVLLLITSLKCISSGDQEPKR